jgi:hypothetical protein
MSDAVAFLAARPNGTACTSDLALEPARRRDELVRVFHLLHHKISVRLHDTPDRGKANAEKTKFGPDTPHSNLQQAVESSCYHLTLDRLTRMRAWTACDLLLD